MTWRDENKERRVKRMVEFGRVGLREAAADRIAFLGTLRVSGGV